MRVSWNKPAALLAMLVFAVAGVSAGGAAAERPPALTDRETAVHVLNRLGFGPRPGDVDRVVSIGIAAYIEQQLSPERIPDGSVEASLKRFPTLAMTTAELYEKFEKPVREARRAKQGEIQDPAMIPFENRPRRIIEELSEARILRAVRSERQLNEVLVDFWMNHFNVFAGKGLDRIFITSFERDVVR